MRLNYRRVVGRWVVCIRTIQLGKLKLGYTVHLEDGLLYRGPALGFLPIPDRLRQLIGWWRPTFDKAQIKGFREARA